MANVRQDGKRKKAKDRPTYAMQMTSLAYKLLSLPMLPAENQYTAQNICRERGMFLPTITHDLEKKSVKAIVEQAPMLACHHLLAFDCRR
jgi:hypothetical protein